MARRRLPHLASSRGRGSLFNDLPQNLPTMARAVSEVLRVIAGIAFFGAAAAVALHTIGVPIGPGELVAILVVDASVAAMVAILLPLRHARTALVVAGIAGAVGVASFFGATIALWSGGGAAIARDSLVVLLGIAPMTAGTISFGGATYLARGVRRARTRRVRMAHAR